MHTSLGYEMRSVLCFGDSNTYGQMPGVGRLERYERSERWPGIMQKALGQKWQIIEEGLSGRTTVHNDPIEGDLKNGRTYLRPCVMSHAPLDLVILMLGTNDLKARFHVPPSEVGMGIGVLIHDIKELAPGPNNIVPEILVVAPPPTNDDIKEWEPIFSGAQRKSHQLALEFEKMADSLEVHFFDAGTVASFDEADGLHLNKEGHQALGLALAQEVQAIGWAT